MQDKNPTLCIITLASGFGFGFCLEWVEGTPGDPYLCTFRTQETLLAVVGEPYGIRFCNEIEETNMGYP